MLRPGLILRLIHINFVLLRHGLDEVILATHLFRPLRFMRYVSPWFWFGSTRRVPRGERIRRALEELGPIFVKFGQMLSTRKDLLPEDIAEALTVLQDKVRPFPGAEARRRIEQAYGQLPLERVFEHFDSTPLASASIAQVHAARLLDGREVVVKVVRPDIERRIRRDLEILYTIAGLAQRYWAEGPRLHPVEVVQEFDKTLMDELDLMREAANAAEIRRHFENSPLLYIPAIHWELCREKVLVQERIFGIPISRTAQLTEAGIDLRKLAERGVEIFFTQVFVHNFFHGDMHPGNIFVNPAHPQDPQYMAVDFGIVGSLTPEDQRYLAENFHAFFNRDYRRVAELHLESGWVPAHTRVEEFESAIRTVCEPIFQKPLKDISFGHFLLRLFQTARRFNMEVQPQLVLLQKTLLAIEGLGRQLYPELDLWQTAKPFIERWMRDRLGPAAVWRGLRNEWPALLEHLPALPRLTLAALRAGERQAEALREQRDEIRRLREEMRESRLRHGSVVIGAALIVSAFLIKGLDGHAPLPLLGGAPADAWVLSIGGILLILSGLRR